MEKKKQGLKERYVEIKAMKQDLNEAEIQLPQLFENAWKKLRTSMRETFKEIGETVDVGETEDHISCELEEGYRVLLEKSDDESVLLTFFENNRNQLGVQLGIEFYAKSPMDVGWNFEDESFSSEELSNKLANR